MAPLQLGIVNYSGVNVESLLIFNPKPYTQMAFCTIKIQEVVELKERKSPQRTRETIPGDHAENPETLVRPSIRKPYTESAGAWYTWIYDHPPSNVVKITEETQPHAVSCLQTPTGKKNDTVQEAVKFGSVIRSHNRGCRCNALVQWRYVVIKKVTSPRTK